MDENKHIYPLGSIRADFMVGTYAGIAIENYYAAKKAMIELTKKDYSTAEGLDEVVDKSAIISTVFAAMCIESFLNNYAATCLGDSEFYDHFDKLSPESKFQLIAKFILKTEINKNEAYYCYFKRLFKARNTYVHNKSFDVSFERMETEEKEKKVHKIWEIQKYHIDNARDGISAMRDIAAFFDKHDINALATIHMFNPHFYEEDCPPEHPNNVVIKEFRVKDIWG